MIGRWDTLRDRWNDIQSSLWFLPTTLVVLAFLLAIGLPELDRNLPDEVGRHRQVLFNGSPDAARTILSVISGSLITVISLLFSITMLTLQQATTQFTPRVVASFTRDRGNQIVLGVYIATFVYSLLVLRQVRDETDNIAEFVPVISTTVAIVLAVICVGLLVYYIHHSSSLLQVSTVISRIQSEVAGQVARLYPERVGEAAEESDPVVSVREPDLSNAKRVGATETGFLRVIDDAVLGEAIPPGGWAVILPRVGQYVLEGQPLVAAGPANAVDDEVVSRVQQAFVVGPERTMTQDAMFGIRQLADIALRALSPGINDPTTAEHAISVLSDALRRLGNRELPSRCRVVEREDDGLPVTIWANRPSFDEFVEEAYGQIIHAAADSPHVLRYLITTLGSVASQVPVECRDALYGRIDRAAASLKAIETPG